MSMYKTNLNTCSISLAMISYKTKQVFILRLDFRPIGSMTAI